MHNYDNLFLCFKGTAWKRRIPWFTRQSWKSCKLPRLHNFCIKSNVAWMKSVQSSWCLCIYLTFLPYCFYETNSNQTLPHVAITVTSLFQLFSLLFSISLLTIMKSLLWVNSGQNIKLNSILNLWQRSNNLEITSSSVEKVTYALWRK